MATATARKPKTSAAGSTTLLEERVISESHKVDREARIIRDVKILGKQSKNGREYTDRALQEAASLYEGATVNVNHPPRTNPNQERGFEEGIAIIRGAKPREDGVYGDLHYFESHPHAPLMLERAEKHAGTFGLSHNADGQTTNSKGRTIVESVTKVRSVDLVGKPATTNGLFESEEEPVIKTLKQILESAPDKTAGRKQLARLIEMDPMLGDVPAEMPMDAATENPSEKPEEQIKAGILAAIMAKLEKAGADVLQKVLADLDIGDSLSAAAAGKPSKPDGGEDKESTQESEREKAEMDARVTKLQESVDELQAERDALKAENTVRVLLESMEREATPVRIKALVALESEADRKALVNEWPKRTAAVNGQPPKRREPLVESQQQGEYKPLSGKELAAAIR